jgi:hypothetical protein
MGLLCLTISQPQNPWEFWRLLPDYFKITFGHSNSTTMASLNSKQTDNLELFQIADGVISLNCSLQFHFFRDVGGPTAWDGGALDEKRRF